MTQNVLETDFGRKFLTFQVSNARELETIEKASASYSLSLGHFGQLLCKISDNHM